MASSAAPEVLALSSENKKTSKPLVRWAVQVYQEKIWQDGGVHRSQVWGKKLIL